MIHSPSNEHVSVICRYVKDTGRSVTLLLAAYYISTIGAIAKPWDPFGSCVRYYVVFCSLTTAVINRAFTIFWSIHTYMMALIVSLTWRWISSSVENGRCTAVRRLILRGTLRNFMCSPIFMQQIICRKKTFHSFQDAMWTNSRNSPESNFNRTYEVRPFIVREGASWCTDHFLPLFYPTVISQNKALYTTTVRMIAVCSVLGPATRILLYVLLDWYLHAW